jgi:hypothetical protein
MDFGEKDFWRGGVAFLQGVFEICSVFTVVNRGEFCGGDVVICGDLMVAISRSKNTPTF